MRKRSQYLNLLLVLSLFSTNKHCFSAPGDAILDMLPVKAVPEGWDEKVSSYDSNTHVATNPENPSQKILTIRLPVNSNFAARAELNRIATEKFDEELKKQNEKRGTPGLGLDKYQDIEDWENADVSYYLKKNNGPQPEGWQSIIPKASKKKKSKKKTETESNATNRNIERVVSLPSPGEEDLGIPSKRTSMSSQEDNEEKIREIINDSIEAFRDEATDDGRKEFIYEGLNQIDQLKKNLLDPNFDENTKQAFSNQIIAFQRLPDALREDEQAIFLKILEEEKIRREPTPSTQELSSEGDSLKRSSLNIDTQLTELQTQIISQNQRRLEQEATKKKIQEPSARTLAAVQFAARQGIPGIPHSSVSTTPRQVFAPGIPGVPQAPSFFTPQRQIPPQTKQIITRPQGFSAAGYSSSKSRKP